MSKKRKTVDVKRVKEICNHMLEYSYDPMDRERKAVAQVLSTILMDTGNYKGFHYLNKDGNPASYQLIQEGNYDETRVRYY